MKLKLASLGPIFKKTFSGWMNDDPFRQSAIIAYYAIFSLPALLVLIINIVGFIFEKKAVNGEIIRQVSGVMGTDTAQQMAKIIENANHTNAGLIPGIIAVVLLLTGATGVFVQLQIVLNQIWGVKQKAANSLLTNVKDRLFSFGLIISIGFLLLVSLAISSVLASIGHWLEGVFSSSFTHLLFVAELLLSLSVISVLFALMFKYLPDVKISWRNVWVGAIVTAVLFVLGKYGLSLYFGKAHPGSVYGAAGSIILVLLWASYSSMIVFFGAEFTKQYALAGNTAVEPTKNGVLINPTGAQSAPVEKVTATHNTKKEHKGIDSGKGLEREMDKLRLHLVIKKLQLKERVLNLFHVRRSI